MNIKYLKSFSSLFCIAVIFLLSLHSCGFANSQLKFADAGKVWWTAPTIIARQDGWVDGSDSNLYTKNGLDLVAFDVNDGLTSKNAVLAGTADVGLVAATPLARGAYQKENEKLVVLASYVEATNLLAIITEKETEATEPIIPKPSIAIVPGTISEFYLHRYGEETSTLDQIKTLSKLRVKPPSVPDAINGDKDVKSAVIWEPFVSKIKNSNSDLYEVIRDENLYTLRLFLVTRPDVIKNKKDALVKFINSINEACEYINDNSEESRKKIAAYLNHDEQELPASLWNDVNFKIDFDYEKMQNLILEDVRLASEVDKEVENNISKSEIEKYFDPSFKENFNNQ